MSRFRVRRRGRPPHPDILTPAEWGVLDGVRDGLSNAEIADRLGVSVNTVRYHVSNILTKVGVPDRQALAAWRGQPAAVSLESRRQWGGLLGLARYLGVAAALVLVAVMAWVALDRLSGSTRELPAAAPEATPSGEEVPATVDPLGANVPFASDGTYWARALMSPSTSNGNPSVAVAENGDIVVGMWISYFEAVAGSYTLDLGGGPATGGGSWDGVIARYDPQGGYLWSRLIAGPDDDGVSDVAVSADGSILVTGAYGDGADFGNGPESAQDERDLFIASYHPDGSLDWVRTYSSNGRDAGRQIGFFPGGDIAWSGSFGAGATIEAFEVSGESRYPGFIARLSPSGEVEWVTSIDGVGSFAIDATDEEVIYAHNNISSVSNPPANPQTGLAALSTQGERLWNLPISPEGRVSVRDISILPGGDAIVVGRFAQPTDFGGGLLEPAGCCSEYTNENSVSDSFVLRVSAAGEHVWSQHWGGNLLDEASAVVREESGTLLVGGTATGLFTIPGISTSLRTSPPAGEFRDHQMYGGYVVRMTEDGEVLKLMSLQQAGRIDGLGPIIVDTPATGEGEMLIGGRYFTSVTFPFGGRIANSEWLDYFIARIEGP